MPRNQGPKGSISGSGGVQVTTAPYAALFGTVPVRQARPQQVSLSIHHVEGR